MQKKWFVIINPTSGNGKSLKRINFIKKQLKIQQIPFTIVTTKYRYHEILLVQNAIKQGFNKFINVGGDGTLHYIINGIMLQKNIITNTIKIAVIPVGTGNDWVKTYKIPTNIKKTIEIIKKENTIYQDIGYLKLLDTNKIHYFNNIAGIGFDAYVVTKLSKLKKLGSISYLLAGLIGFLNYKKSKILIHIKDKKITSKIFMISIGLCKYSGGGMQLTDYKNHKPSFFDITLIKNITLSKVILNIKKLYNGSIFTLKEVEKYQVKKIKIRNLNTKIPFYIQADGELLGKGNVDISIIKNAIQFIV